MLHLCTQLLHRCERGSAYLVQDGRRRHGGGAKYPQPWCHGGHSPANRPGGSARAESSCTRQRRQVQEDPTRWARQWRQHHSAAHDDQLHVADVCAGVCLVWVRTACCARRCGTVVDAAALRCRRQLRLLGESATDWARHGTQACEAVPCSLGRPPPGACASPYPLERCVAPSTMRQASCRTSPRAGHVLWPLAFHLCTWDACGCVQGRRLCRTTTWSGLFERSCAFTTSECTTWTQSKLCHSRRCPVQPQPSRHRRGEHPLPS